MSSIVNVYYNVDNNRCIQDYVDLFVTKYIFITDFFHSCLCHDKVFNFLVSKELIKLYEEEDAYVSSLYLLIGTTALFISSKYEEIYPPDIGEFVYITDDSYSKLQILNMEKVILKVPLR